MSPSQSGISCVLGVSRKPCRTNLGAPARSISIFNDGTDQVSSWRYGGSGLAEYDEMEGRAWDRQSEDGVLTKGTLATECLGAKPTYLGKMGANEVC